MDAGNTVVLVEHHLDTITSADWVIDLGPGGGDEGGRMVAAGTPEEVARAEGSATAPYLAKRLSSRGGPRQGASGASRVASAQWLRGAGTR